MFEMFKLGSRSIIDTAIDICNLSTHVEALT